MSAEILPVPLDMLDDYWPHVWPHLAKGVEVSGRTRAQLAEDMLRDRARVWFASTSPPRRIRAAWFTEIVQVDGLRTLSMFGIGGEAPTEWVGDAFARMEAYAIDEECSAALFTGRKGWSRLGSGYEAVRLTNGESVFRKVLS